MSDDVLGAGEALIDKAQGQQGSLLDLTDAAGATRRERIAQAREDLPWQPELIADTIGGVAGLPAAVYGTAAKIARPATLIGRSLLGALSGGLDSMLSSYGHGERGAETLDNAAIGAFTGGLLQAPIEGGFAAKNWLTGSSSAEDLKNMTTSAGLDDVGMSPRSILEQTNDPTAPNNYFQQSRPHHSTESIDRATETLPQLDLSLDPVGNANKLRQTVQGAGDEWTSATREVADVTDNLKGSKSSLDRSIEHDQALGQAKTVFQDTLNVFGNRTVPNKQLQSVWTNSFSGTPVGKNRKVLTKYSAEISRLMKNSPTKGGVSVADLQGLLESINAELSIKGARKLGDAYASLTALKKGIVSAMDQATGGNYAQANANYSAAYNAKSAFDAGEEMMGKRNFTAQDVDYWISKQNNPALVQEFRDGMQAALKKRVDRGIMPALQNLLGDVGDPLRINTDNVTKLRALMPKEDVDNLLHVYESIGPRQDALQRYIDVANNKLKNIEQSPRSNQRQMDAANMISGLRHGGLGGLTAGTGRTASTVRMVTNNYPHLPSPRASEQYLGLLNAQGQGYRDYFSSIIDQGSMSS
jgi:hypothetical protein